MSVDIKTPTRAQFDHPEFPCCKTTVMKSEVEMLPAGGEVPVFEELQQLEQGKSLTAADLSDADVSGQWRSAGRLKRKRSSVNSNSSLIPFKKRFGRHGKEKQVNTAKSILPTKFLLGGNITDPLNLNSMCDEEINRALNESTPQSSPLPMPMRRHQVQVFVPPNINDPLNLNSTEDIDISLISPKGVMKRKRNKHKRKKSGMADTTEESCPEVAASIDSKLKDIIDQVTSQGTVAKAATLKVFSTAELQSQDINKIVSPVIPQTSPKRKRKRTSSEHKSDVECNFSRQDSDKSSKSDKLCSPHPPKFRRQLSMGANLKRGKKARSKDHLFIYGNYSRYYGYRNPNFDQDRRLKSLDPEWIEGKDVLDIGCNVGHVTLSIACFLNPRKIVGLDIDGKLIRAAKKNIRYYLTSQQHTEVGKFPVSLPVTFGPIAAPPVRGSVENPGFPHNILFMEV